jgi:hypothetical protein
MKACDNGQPGTEQDDGTGTAPGRNPDTFAIRVTGPNGVVYQRSGPISGGNVQSHLK